MSGRLTNDQSRIAAIYARVSSERQRQEQTIASQTAALRDLAEQRGLVVPEEFVFEDNGFSGSTSGPRSSNSATGRSTGASRSCCAMRRTGWRAGTPTRCWCLRSSRAQGSRWCSPRSPSDRAPLRASCCVSSRGSLPSTSERRSRSGVAVGSCTERGPARCRCSRTRPMSTSCCRSR